MKQDSKWLSRSSVVRWWSVCAAWGLLSASALGQSADEPQVGATDYGTFNLSVQDTDLAQVLQMLSIESEKNIITSKSVSGTVTANLFDVTFYDALDAILKANGYVFEEEGNFLYIYTKAEYDEIVASRLKPETQMYELDYLSAADAFEFITPVLSEIGQASYRGDVQPGIKPEISDVGADTYAYTARLVVKDYPENLDRITSMLEQLDTPPQQVLVEATILQTTVDEANAFGIDIALIDDLDFLNLHTPLGAVNNLLAGDDTASGFQPLDNKANALSVTPGATTGPATIKLGVITDNVSVFMRALDEVSDSTVLARPKIMALNRQRAEVLVGTRIGYLSTTATETTTTQSVEFLDTGIQLIFRPFISKDGSIRLELAPSVSEASLRTVTDANGLLVTIPDENTNELTTNVRVKDGQTLVLGGLFREATTITRRQVPLLGDIPLLGAAFRGQDDAIDRLEIMFLITPTVVKDAELWDAGQNALDYVERVRIGAREGLLNFNRDAFTSQYNHQAQEARMNGELGMARWLVNNSLRLNPIQPEVIELREQITTEANRFAYERSVTERAFRKSFGEINHKKELAGVQTSKSDDMTFSEWSDEEFEQLLEDPIALLDLLGDPMFDNQSLDIHSETTGVDGAGASQTSVDKIDAWQEGRSDDGIDGPDIDPVATEAASTAESSSGFSRWQREKPVAAEIEIESPTKKDDTATESKLPKPSLSEASGFDAVVTPFNFELFVQHFMNQFGGQTNQSPVVFNEPGEFEEQDDDTGIIFNEIVSGEHTEAPEED